MIPNHNWKVISILWLLTYTCVSRSPSGGILSKSYKTHKSCISVSVKLGWMQKMVCGRHKNEDITIDILPSLTCTFAVYIPSALSDCAERPHLTQSMRHVIFSGQQLTTVVKSCGWAFLLSFLYWLLRAWPVQIQRQQTDWPVLLTMCGQTDVMIMITYVRSLVPIQLMVEPSVKNPPTARLHSLRQ